MTDVVAATCSRCIHAGAWEIDGRRVTETDCLHPSSAGRWVSRESTCGRFEPEFVMPEPSEPVALLGGVGRPGGHDGLPPPPGAARLLAMRTGGARPDGPVIASFVGLTGFANLHLFPKSGVRYDWRLLHGLSAQIFLRPGTDVAHALDNIFAESNIMESYPVLVDVDLRQVAFVVETRPFKTWPVKSGGSVWREFFPQ